MPLLKLTMEHIRKHPTVADDAFTPSRVVKQVFQVMAMKTTAKEEIGATTALSHGMGHKNETAFGFDGRTTVVFIRPALQYG